MPLRRRLLALLAAASVLTAAAVLLTASRSGAPAPLAERAEAVSRELRCPVCGGETIAESQSDVAVAMRAEVVDQLALGRSPDQVRDWFAERYGPEVVLRPATDGAGLVVWLLPAVALGVGVVVAARLVGAPARRRRLVPGLVAALAAGVLVAPALAAGREGPAPLAADDYDAPLAGLRAAASAGDGASWLPLGRALTERGRHAEAVDAYRSALAAGEPPEQVHVALGLALVRSGRGAEAVPLLREVVDARPDEPEPLLVLAAALRDDEPDQARAVLRRFLSVAPDHAAAPGVRRAVGDQQPP